MITQNHMTLMGAARNLERMSAQVRRAVTEPTPSKRVATIRAIAEELHQCAELLKTLPNPGFEQAPNPKVTKAQREEAEDLGLMICEVCGTVYSPEPSYVNGGHQCDGTGLDPSNLLSDPPRANNATPQPRTDSP